MKDYLEKVDYSNPKNKHKMNDLFEMAVYSVKDTDKELYDHVKCELYEMVYGKEISDEMADEWVHEMKPMAKWTKEEVANVASSYGITNIPLNCAYVIMNMLYSDSSNVYGNGEDTESLERYLQGLKDWFFDTDLAIDGKIKLYNYRKYIYNAED